MKNSTAFILLLLSVGLFYTFISPHYATVQALGSQADQYKSILANVSELSAKRDDLNVKYQNVPQDEVARLEKILPDNVDTVDLAMNLDSIASRYGISIKNVQTEATGGQSGAIVQSDGGQPYNAVTVSFTFVSTYANFRKFLNDIEKSLRIIDIHTLTFQAGESGLYEFHIAVDTYWLK